MAVVRCVFICTITDLLYVLIFKRIKSTNIMIKRLDFIEWARANGHAKTQVPMNLLEMILDYQKYAESEFKNLNIQRVSHLFGEHYPMCEPQPVQLDCRETECRYHKNGACNNVAPAITIHKGKVTCWTGGS